MMVVVQGTKEFSDYNVFLRAISVALSMITDNDPYFYVYTVGPQTTNSFVFEFCNLSERGLKARGKKIKYYKVQQDWVKENIQDINYFIYLSEPNQPLSYLANGAKKSGVEVGIFQH